MEDLTGEYRYYADHSYTGNSITGILWLFQTADTLRGYYCVWRAWDDNVFIPYTPPTTSGPVTGRLVENAVQLDMAGTPILMERVGTKIGLFEPTAEYMAHYHYVDRDETVKRLAVMQHLIDDGSFDSAQLEAAFEELMILSREAQRQEAFRLWLDNQFWICRMLPQTDASEQFLAGWKEVEAGTRNYVPVPPSLKAEWRVLFDRALPVNTKA